MRLSRVMKKGKLHSCHLGKRKCHPKLVMTFGRNEKRDRCVFQTAVGSKTGLLLL